MEKNIQVLRFVKIFIMLFVAAFTSIKPQEPAQNNLAILPFQSIGITDDNMQVVHSILRVEISKQGAFNIIPDKTTAEALSGEICADNECAVEIGKELKASTILGGKLAALGEKLIVQYFLVDVALEK